MDRCIFKSKIRNPKCRWKVAGYGWPGRIANACSLRGMRVQIPRLPLGPDGETEITPRFYRGVPGSSPGRGNINEENGRATRQVTGIGWKPIEQHNCLAGSI